MTLNTALFTSKSGEHETPQKFYDRLNAKYGFTLDPCCTDRSAKCENYFTKKENGLKASWQGHTVFMNPPYGRGIGVWLAKAEAEHAKGNCQIVALLPGRIDTAWFHRYVYQRKLKWRPLCGRLIFEKDGKPCRTLDKKTGKWKITAAPFPSILVYWI